MSKVIKQMQMDSLKNEFKDVRDMVLLQVVGLGAIAENHLRLNLRKKGIRLQMVKNSLARRVFKDMGVQVQAEWAGPTTVAWGGSSVSELSKEIETIVKKHEKQMKVKLAVADGQEVTFDVALKMPTKAEILSTIVGMIMSPATQIAGQIAGPATQIAGQLKTLTEKKEAEPAAPADAPAAPAT